MDTNSDESDGGKSISCSMLLSSLPILLYTNVYIVEIKEALALVPGDEAVICTRHWLNFINIIFLLYNLTTS